MPGVEHVHEGCEPHQTHEQHASPIEVHRRDFVGIWEERPDEAPARVDECDDVDWQTGSPETPTAFGKREVADTTVSYAACARSVSIICQMCMGRAVYRLRSGMFPSSGKLSVRFNFTKQVLGKHTAFEASDSTALKATVLPMLMSETIHTKTAVATIALAGTWKCGLTLRDCHVSAGCVHDNLRQHSLFQAT